MSLKPTDLYTILLKKYGNLNWWPMDRSYHERIGSDPRFEIIIGAVLTQNTAWSNVEKALLKLKAKNILDINSINNISEQELRMMIRSSGFFNQKARRLKFIAYHLHENYDRDLDRFFDRDFLKIRDELLAINGIGPETADSILLYAGNKPIFVVDAYTRRLCQRIPINVNLSYEHIQKYFQDDLSEKFNKNDLSRVFNELHAQIVILAKEFCKKKPLCDNCPLYNYCDY